MKHQGSDDNNIVEKNKKKYPVLKYSMVFSLFFIPLFITVLIMDMGNFLPTINEKMAHISYLYSKIPLYNLWTDYLNGYVYYENYKYMIDKGFILSGGINSKWTDFYFKIFFETLPLYLVLLFFIKPKYKTVHNRYYFDDKTEQEAIKIINKLNLLIPDNDQQSEFTKLKGELTKLYFKEVLNQYNFQLSSKNPEKKLYEMISTSGLNKINRKEKINVSKFESTKPYLSNLINNHIIMLENNIDLYINEEENFFIDKKNGEVLNRELYFSSLEKTVTVEELKSYYKYVLLFYLAKNFTNFEMYQYSENLDVPIEIKKLCKWISSSNCPDTFIYEKGDKIIYCEIYYRKYRLMKYFGREYKHMREYLLYLEKERKIERKTPLVLDTDTNKKKKKKSY